MRWARTIRFALISYYGYVVTHAALWALGASRRTRRRSGNCGFGNPHGGGNLGGTAILKDRQVPRNFWLIPLRDLFGFAVWWPDSSALPCSGATGSYSCGPMAAS